MTDWDNESFRKIYKEDQAKDLLNDYSDYQSIEELVRDRKPSGTICSEEDLAKIEANFHNLIRYRCRNAKKSLEWIESQELPQISNELLQKTKVQWFGVDGMYGGFSYALFDLGGPILITESWSRVFGGSGEQHRVSLNEVKLVAKGFV